MRARGVDLRAKLEAAFILYDPIRWEELFHYLLQHLRLDPKLPIYVVNNDVTYADEFRLPRFAFGTFTNALKALVASELQCEPNITYYGKPSPSTYSFVGSNPLECRGISEIQVPDREYLHDWR